MKWNYVQPVEIIFETGGINRINEIIAKIGGKKGILICDPFFASNGLAEKVKSASDGLITTFFSKITPNPLVEEVDECAEIVAAGGFDFAVALGGGSAIDTAKAVCITAANGGSVRDYHTGGKPIEKDGILLIAVPTTAGTGSEVTSVSVLTDTAKGKKGPIGSPKMYPKIALIDPELTVSLPKQVTASAGLDVLSHALEGFWSKNHQPICDAVALHAAGLVFKWIEEAYNNGGNIKAREAMCEASVIAGLAFALPKTAASHACSFPLTVRYGLPHGEACAFTLDYLCKVNAKSEDGRVDDFARKLAFENASAMGDEITRLKKAMGMAVTLADAGIAESDLHSLAEACKHPNLDNNPIALSEDDLVKMFMSMK